MSIDRQQLRGYISDMYSDVARFPRGDFHFHIGRQLMERLGYAPHLLDQVPAGALESFAGVGFYMDMAPIKAGERVLDLGAGAGSDVFYAAVQTGPGGHAVGLDMTAQMLEKSRKNLQASSFEHVEFVEGYVETPPFEDQSFDCIVSNGVINLVVDKPAVFEQAYRVLKPGGRMMFSDIVTGVELPASVRENCELWAECIGGALEQKHYLSLLEEAGFAIERVRENDVYGFKGESTARAANKFQVKSLSILAYRPS
jgi:SAM-dependent methyltransferase